MTSTQPSPPPRPQRRLRLLPAVALSTFLLLTAVVGMLLALYVQRTTEDQLRHNLRIYRQPQTEAIFDALERPVMISYDEDGRLDRLLKDVRTATAGLPNLPKGIPVYVDPIGLQEAEMSLNTSVERPADAGTRPLGEELEQVLRSVGLGYVVKYGFLQITSIESVDQPVDDNVDPYLRYRDVLR